MAKPVEFELKIKDSATGVVKELGIEATKTSDAVKEIEKSAEEVGGSLKNLAASSLVFDTLTRAIQTVNNAVQQLSAPYNSFEQSMRAANTMAGKSGEEYEALKEQVLELSKAIPVAREELTNGLYQVISNGVPEDNWIDFLEQSSKASVGGLADLGQTVTVTSTLIKNYGLAWDKAQEVQDKIQMTAKNGVTSFEQLGQALPRVSGRAAQLGVTMDELMAVFATTTGVTGNTAEVSTQLAAVLNALIKPSSEAQTAAAAMGISFNAASVQACGGLKNFLTELDASVQAYAAKTGQLSKTIYGQLFGSAEALNLLGSLTGEQKDKFVENVSAMSESAGSIEQAYGEMASTGTAAAQLVENQTNAWKDHIAVVASAVAPYTDLVNSAGVTILSVIELTNGLVSLTRWAGKTKTETAALAGVERTAATATNRMGVAQATAAAQTSADASGCAARWGPSA